MGYYSSLFLVSFPSYAHTLITFLSQLDTSKSKDKVHTCNKECGGKLTIVLSFLLPRLGKLVCILCSLAAQRQCSTSGKYDVVVEIITCIQ